MGGEGRERERRRGTGNGREGGRGKVGKGGLGTGRDRGGKDGGEEWGWWWGGEARGARHGLRPPRDKLWIRPCTQTVAAVVLFADCIVTGLAIKTTGKPPWKLLQTADPQSTRHVYLPVIFNTGVKKISDVV